MNLAADRGPVAAIGGEAALGIDFRERGLQGRYVAAMAVDEEETVEPVPRKRFDDIADDGDQGRRPERRRTGKAQMMLGHADVDGRRHHGLQIVADTIGDQFRAEGVGADEAGGAVLFGGADGLDNSRRTLQIGLDLGPGTKLQPHGASLRP